MCVSIRIKDFITEELWIYAIVFSVIALFSWIFDKWIEGVMFCIAHTVVRTLFDKQFHFNKTACCITLTLGVAWFGITSTFPLTISLLSSIPVSLIVSWLGFFVQDRVDYIGLCEKLQNKLDQLLTADIYRMTDNELRQYGASKHLSEIQQDILAMRVIEHLKISEICHYRNYGRTTIKYHIGEIERKLQIDKI
jgi:hypothetical protein